MTVNKLTLPAKENAVQSKINEIIDNFPTSTTVDQTYDGTSANAQSGVAINGELTSNYQLKLVSGTNIKTINNTSLLGSGDIDVKDVFVAEYGVTSYSDILSEYNAGKLIFLKSDYLVVGTGEQGTYLIPLEKHNVKTDSTVEFIFSAIDGTVQKTRIINSSNTWSMDTSVLANATLSNVSSISNNSAVKTALDGKVSKSGDTMTGDLAISEDATAKIELTNTSFDATSTTAPTSNLYAGAIDIFGSDNYHVGYFRTRHSSANYFQSQMGVRRSINNTDYEANITVAIKSDGTSICTFPNTNCVDGQWVKNVASLSTSSAVGTYNLTNTLKAKLPNDSYNYEILLAVYGRSTGSSQCFLQTAYTDEEFVCWLTANSRSAGTFIILPINAARTLTQKVAGTAFAAIDINLEAYRRVGTNS